MSVTAHFRQVFPFSSIEKSELYPLYALQYKLHVKSEYTSELSKKIGIKEIPVGEHCLYVSEIIRCVEEKYGQSAKYLEVPLSCSSKWIMSIPKTATLLKSFNISADACECIKKVFGDKYNVSESQDSEITVVLNAKDTAEESIYMGWGKILSEYYGKVNAHIKTFESLIDYLTHDGKNSEWRSRIFQSISRFLAVDDISNKTLISIASDVKSTKNMRAMICQFLSKSGFQKVHPNHNQLWTMNSSMFPALIQWYRKITKAVAVDIPGPTIVTPADIPKEEGYKFRSSEQVKAMPKPKPPLFTTRYTGPELERAILRIKDEDAQKMFRQATEQASESRDRYNGSLSQMWELLTNGKLKVANEDMVTIHKIYDAMNRNWEQWGDVDAFMGNRGLEVLEQNVYLSQLLEEKINEIISNNGGDAYIIDEAKKMDAMSMIEPFVDNFVNTTLEGMAKDDYKIVIAEAEAAERLSKPPPTTTGIAANGESEPRTATLEEYGDNALEFSTYLTDYLQQEGIINADTKEWVDKMMGIATGKIVDVELPEGPARKKVRKTENGITIQIGGFWESLGYTSEEADEKKKLIKKRLISALVALVAMVVLGISGYLLYNSNWFNWKNDVNIACKNLAFHIERMKKDMAESPSAFDIKDEQGRVVRTLRPYNHETGEVNWEDYHEYRTINEQKARADWDVSEAKLQSSMSVLRERQEDSLSKLENFQNTIENKREQEQILDEMQQKVEGINLDNLAKSANARLTNEINHFTEVYRAGNKMHTAFVESMPAAFKKDLDDSRWNDMVKKAFLPTEEEIARRISFEPATDSDGNVVYNIGRGNPSFYAQSEATGSEITTFLAGRNALGEDWLDRLTPPERRQVESQITLLSGSAALMKDTLGKTIENSELQIGAVSELKKFMGEKIDFSSVKEQLEDQKDALDGTYENLLALQQTNDEKNKDALDAFNEWKKNEFAKKMTTDYFKEFSPDTSGTWSAQSFFNNIFAMETSSQASFQNAVDTYGNAAMSVVSYMGKIKFLIKTIMPVSMQKYIPDFIFALAGGNALQQLEYVGRLMVQNSVTSPLWTQTLKIIASNIFPSVGLFFSTMVTFTLHNRLIHVFALLFGNIIGSWMVGYGKETMDSVGEHSTGGMMSKFTYGWGLFLWGSGKLLEKAANIMSTVVNAFTTLGLILTLIGTAVTLIGSLFAMAVTLTAAIVNVGPAALATYLGIVVLGTQTQIGSTIFYSIIGYAQTAATLIGTAWTAARLGLQGLMSAVIRKLVSFSINMFYKSWIWLFQINDSKFIKSKTKTPNAALHAVFEELTAIALLSFVRWLFKRYSDSGNFRKRIVAPQSAAEEIPIVGSDVGKVIKDYSFSELNYKMSYEEFEQQRDQAWWIMHQKIVSDFLLYEKEYKYADHQTEIFPYTGDDLAEKFKEALDASPPLWWQTQLSATGIMNSSPGPGLAPILNPQLSGPGFRLELEGGDASLVPIQ